MLQELKVSPHFNMHSVTNKCIRVLILYNSSYRYLHNNSTSDIADFSYMDAI